jgi:hypothetical protein
MTRTLAIAALLAVACPVGAQSAASPEDHARAGFPEEISRWARPSDTGRYVGYFVGGGAWNYRRSDLPTADEGTWGWDFTGGRFRRRVMLNWWHGRRDQGGAGAYATDGPRALPPVGNH